MRVLVVGAGFSGVTVARLLAERGHHVTVIDQRGHVAGNAHDELHACGIRFHTYGPHLFHTNNQKVVEWLSQFTDWLPYQHRVKAMLNDGRLVTLPVNRNTVEIVGRDRVLDTFFRPYTKKMWGVEIEALDPDILARVPIRDDLNELYFPNDSFQAIPAKGYTRLVENILDHSGINLILNERFSHSLESDFDHVFNSMPIDEYFGADLGPLPYRSIKFHHIVFPCPQVFPVATVNFTHDGPNTRVTEWCHLPGHGKSDQSTLLTYEEPCDYRANKLERYYPVKDTNGINRSLYQLYRERVSPKVTFIGRCGLYAYLDMHQAISSAHSTTEVFLSQHICP